MKPPLIRRARKAFRAVAAFALLTGAALAVSPFPEETAATRPGVCLVLSGGGARGLAHIGVLKMLDEMGVHPACVIGTSAGALVGSLYCSGMKASDIEALLKEQDFSQLTRDTPQRRRLDFEVKRNAVPPSILVELKNGVLSFPEGVLEGERVLAKLNETFFNLGTVDVRDFDRLPVPFRAVAADVRTGRLVVFDRGRLTTAVRASIAVPLLFTPVHLDGMMLVDGGVLNNVAVDIARELGYRKIIAVNVARPPSPERKRLENLFDIMDESYTLARREKDALLLKMASVVIEPDMEGVSVTDFNRVDDLLKRGYQAATGLRKPVADLFAGESAGPLPPPPGDGKYAVPVSVVGVTGARRVSPGRVLRKSDVRPGKVIDPEELGESVENILAMDQFRRVDYDLSFDRGVLSLEYLVGEAPRRELNFTLHFDTDYQFLGFGRYIGRGFLGSPLDLEVRVTAGLVRDYRMMLKAPIPFGNHSLNFQVGGYYSSQPRELYLDKNPLEAFDERHGGMFLGTSLSLGSTFGLFGDVHLERLDLRSKSWFDENGGQFDAFARFGAGFDTIDDWTFPRSGIRLEAFVEKHFRLFDRGKDYTRAQASGDVYFPLSPRMVLNLSGTAATGYDIPVYQLFYAGGYNFMHWASPPLPGYRLDELFGKDLWTASFELRRKMGFASTGIIDASYLYLRAGVAGVRIPDFSGPTPNLDTPLRAYKGIGAGLAVATRVGPVRLFIGFGEDKRVNWTLSLGPEF
ncbi:MAG: patatin-like phospholipase family protein [Acidobacteria bacterium]|nr:patatin-like phospholipase family protein [Acidobacteriota bacterium]